MTGSPHKPPYFSLYHTLCQDLNTLTALTSPKTRSQRLCVKQKKKQSIKVNLLLFVPSLISVTIPLSDSQADPRNEAEPRDCYLPLTGMSSHLHHPFASSMITWSPMFAKKNLSFFLRLPPPPFSLARTSLPAELKERRFLSPRWLLIHALHEGYITRLKQGCCNERYLEGTRSLRNSSICYREDFANPQPQCCTRRVYISSSHTRPWGHSRVEITLQNGDSVAQPWYFRLFMEATMTPESIIRR